MWKSGEVEELDLASVLILGIQLRTLVVRECSFGVSLV
jgi:hypothetical protein